MFSTMKNLEKKFQHCRLKEDKFIITDLNLHKATQVQNHISLTHLIDKMIWIKPG